jgi:hypothetical protein
MLVKKAFLTEYQAYFLLDDNKIYSAQDNGHGTVALVPYPIDNVVDAGAALHNLAIVTGSGQVHFAQRPGFAAPLVTKIVTGITDGVKASGLFSGGQPSYYAIVKKDGNIAVFKEDNVNDIAIMKKPAGAGKFVDVVCASVLLCLDDQGNVYQYDWQSSTNIIKQLPDLRITEGTKVTLPGAATDIAGQRWGGNVALVNGKPYVWGRDTRNIGFEGSIITPKEASAAWGITKSLKLIEAGDDTVHFIDVDGHIGGLGEQATGQVGNGVRHPKVIETNTWDMAWSLITKKAVYIGGERKFKSIFKGNSYCFYSFAIEESGRLHIFGGRLKGAMTCQGVMMDSDTANLQSNVADMPTIWAVKPEETYVYKPKSFFLDKTQYPRPEYVLPVTPPIEPPVDPVPVKKLLYTVTTKIYDKGAPETVTTQA